MWGGPWLSQPPALHAAATSGFPSGTFHPTIPLPIASPSGPIPWVPGKPQLHFLRPVSQAAPRHQPPPRGADGKLGTLGATPPTALLPSPCPLPWNPRPSSRCTHPSPGARKRGGGSLSTERASRRGQCWCCWVMRYHLCIRQTPLRSAEVPRGLGACAATLETSRLRASLSVDTIQFDPLNKHLLSACSRMLSTGPGPEGGSPPRYLSRLSCPFVPAPPFSHPLPPPVSSKAPSGGFSKHPLILASQFPLCLVYPTPQPQKGGPLMGGAGGSGFLRGHLVPEKGHPGPKQPGAGTRGGAGGHLGDPNMQDLGGCSNPRDCVPSLTQTQCFGSP